MKNSAFRIGVICEGPTDYHAISCLIGAALESQKINAKFIDLQPNMDSTQADGGWSLIEKWFENYQPDIRVHRYLKGGFFEQDLDEKSCDVFLIQMDSDILDNRNFISYIGEKYNLAFNTLDTPLKRGEAISQVLEKWAKSEECSNFDKKRHIYAPAVESTETWCIASFKRTKENLEATKGVDLCEKFMDALHQSEGRTPQKFSEVDKSVSRRKKFCQKHVKGHQIAREQCFHFNQAVDNLISASALFL
ncbi:hypothetical protein [Azospirillum palustre]|uniref:hypothetical protein n=1 Tax=Azospirillum palustre TaxID=2044885 RepID=UPI0011782B1C|nr:hypothetical protein [Azospirillum palustre]